jgi:hypothetical protein
MNDWRSETLCWDAGHSANSGAVTSDIKINSTVVATRNLHKDIAYLDARDTEADA